ncbi:acetyl/propionyl/methylcrotonyl-CoA carboxylase subunit alpha [Siculibacillus lacustris]|uniref:propionyl-CoA carboxylase n=1 Tax=Siculibacillus lacustris TaxID=1549641 RepID=A0A4Q9VGC7_9HYPH|nr:acetyl/propionyl/methylcrotonyl-CoA carboxylase subunit alpha [Siculibacillus lacustris]TBW34060.1 acetyl/propionyl/methylcrotonyl-CoA carboxylase subunit alpha [Siculibacillus lacustris]
MFKKILIANRGEIACRVIKTARKMGIATVAVYSDADRDAVHVEMADEAILIGPPPAAQSYLLPEKIIAACLETGAEAVHPGYGFLSERASFPTLLKQNGIVFIGPNSRAIEAMGDKIESKKFANAARVTTVPGFLGVIESPDHAVQLANEIGYPVMIKASAGGGGKGMRIAWNDVECREGFQLSKNEAAASFGDDRVFVEKFIVDPRHIEIQVLGDKHGNVIYLGERECSIQRRNQKVIEEAPSPLLDEATRRKMGEQAVALAKAVDYDSAGTVEFVADQNKNFYFLEMNTRLQVEHPVTELVTGIDLVEQMIRVAAGEPLSLKQSEVTLTGWAVESRIYAEDPLRSFLPSIGRLVRYRPPEEGSDGDITVRNDTGVVEGSEISMYYDPMIAKLVTHAPTRLEAIDAQADALDAFVIDGIQHNIPFLTALHQHPRWREARLSTGFIKEEFPDGFHPLTPAPEDRRILALVALAVEILRRDRLDNLPGRLRPHNGVLREDWVVRLEGEYIHIKVPSGFVGVPVEFSAILDGESVETTVSSRWFPGDLLWVGEIGETPVTVQVRPVLNGVELRYRGATTIAKVLMPKTAALDALMPIKAPPDMSKYLLCPMPGQIVSIDVVDGEDVKAGQTLAVVEAMKMQNVLRAERDCKVKACRAKAGDSLAVDAVIIEFE